MPTLGLENARRQGSSPRPIIDRRLDHVGAWSADIPADVAHFVGAGWAISAAARPADDGFGSFAYVTTPTGMTIELVSAAARPRFTEWFAGGSLGNDR